MDIKQVNHLLAHFLAVCSEEDRNSIIDWALSETLQFDETLDTVDSEGVYLSIEWIAQKLELEYISNDNGYFVGVTLEKYSIKKIIKYCVERKGVNNPYICLQDVLEDKVSEDEQEETKSMVRKILPGFSLDTFYISNDN